VDDLLRLGGPVAEHLALMTPDSRPFRFDASSAPSLPSSATTGRIVIIRGLHSYGGYWRADRLGLYATRPTLRALGVIVLASLFARPDSAADITLSHPASDIRTLRIRTPPARPDPLQGLALAPLWYDYWPEQPGRHPWGGGEPVDPTDLPALYLTNDDELAATDEQWLARDTVVGFGTPQGTARFGQFLIDIGSPVTERDEYDLEGEAGFRGVAPLSAELKVSLPGSFGWEPRYNLD
jgi:hypothetical protein